MRRGGAGVEPARPPIHDVRTGANTSANSNAPVKANPYVKDIGAKILPGTPRIVNRGRKATRITRVEKSTGLAASAVASAITSKAGSPGDRLASRR